MIQGLAGGEAMRWFTYYVCSSGFCRQDVYRYHGLGCHNCGYQTVANNIVFTVLSKVSPRQIVGTISKIYVRDIFL